MALFDMQCQAKGCRHRENDVVLPNGKEPVLDCPKCGEPMKRIYNNPPRFSFGFTPGYNRGAGRYFDTQKERDTYLAENDKRLVK